MQFALIGSAAMSSCLATGSGYDPSSAVEAFHDIPHIDIDLQDSPEQFDPSNSKYWEVKNNASSLTMHKYDAERGRCLLQLGSSMVNSYK